MASPVDRKHFASVDLTLVSTDNSQNAPALQSQFCGGLCEWWEKRRASGVFLPDLQISSIPQPGFRKSAPPEVLRSQALRHKTHISSRNYGGYYFFFL